MKQFNVIPECYVDTNLISTLIGAEVNHQYGCGNVARILKEQKKDEFAIGIIDKDKKIPGYMNEFVSIAKRDYLELYKHPVRAHYFILIVPAVDTLLLECAKTVGIDLHTYGLPTTLKELTKVTKKCDSNKNQTFTKLIKDLCVSNVICALARTLKYLLQKRYDVEKEVLKQIFLS